MHPNQITRDNASYDDWMQAANRYLFVRLGVSIYDLADFRSRDLYDDGASAEEAALTALEEDNMGAIRLDWLMAGDIDGRTHTGTGTTSRRSR